MKNSVTTLLSSTGLLLAADSVLAHSGHTSELFHSHEATTLASMGAALIISAAVIAGYKLIKQKKATAKIKIK